MFSVSPSASASTPPTIVNSISSRSWRRNVMMESINAFFNRHKEPVAVPTSPPTPDQQHSEATTVVKETKDVNTEEKDIGGSGPVSPGPSDRSLLRYRSTSSLSPNEGGEERDPFAGGVDGGVTYQSMKWWYVVLLARNEVCSDQCQARCPGHGR